MSTTNASDKRFEAEAIVHAERSQLQIVVRRFLHHRLAMMSLFAFLFLLLFAFLGPLFYEWDHQYRPGLIPNGKAPSADHPLGTVRGGGDMLGMIMRGTQQSLKVGLLVAALDIGIGALWGATAGMFRGWVDAVMMRVVDIIFIIPFLVVVATISSGLEGGVTWWKIALVIGLLGWGATARLVRAEVLSLREREFIEAARAAGASNFRIIFRHLLPNTTGIILVAATLAIVTAILTEAALSFLGLGIQAPDTSLGSQVSEGVDAAFTRPWTFYFPGVTLVVILLTFNFIGDGLRDAFDPRQTIERK